MKHVCMNAYMHCALLYQFYHIFFWTQKNFKICIFFRNVFNYELKLIKILIKHLSFWMKLWTEADTIYYGQWIPWSSAWDTLHSYEMITIFQLDNLHHFDWTKRRLSNWIKDRRDIKYIAHKYRWTIENNRLQIINQNWLNWFDKNKLYDKTNESLKLFMCE